MSNANRHPKSQWMKPVQKCPPSTDTTLSQKHVNKAQNPCPLAGSCRLGSNTKVWVIRDGEIWFTNPEVVSAPETAKQDSADDISLFADITIQNFVTSNQICTQMLINNSEKIRIDSIGDSKFTACVVQLFWLCHSWVYPVLFLNNPVHFFSKSAFPRDRPEVPFEKSSDVILGTKMEQESTGEFRWIDKTPTRKKATKAEV